MDKHKHYCKTCVKRPLKNRQNHDKNNDKLYLNEGRKYYRMLHKDPWEHSKILLTCIKIGLENQFVVFLREAVLHRFYCNFSFKHIAERNENLFLQPSILLDYWGVMFEVKGSLVLCGNTLPLMSRVYKPWYFDALLKV